MRVTRIVLSLTLFVSFVLVLQNRVSAQVGNEKEDLQKLFDRAVAAEGLEYAQLRDAIVARGVEAVPFLKQKCSDKDRTHRILAAAMLSWINEPQENKRREELVHQVLVWVHSRHFRSGMLTSVGAEALGPYSRGHARGEGRIELEDELHEVSAVPFLLELVLKGVIGRPRPEDAERYTYRRSKPTERSILVAAKNPKYCLWARWYATALVGGLQGADVIPVLTDLLQSNKSYELRACAATGLRRTKRLDVVEPLIAALADEMSAVRRSARYALVKITGEDYGWQDIDQQQGKYRTWWKQNKARLLKEK